MRQKVWFITGISRGLSHSIAQAALDQGHIVIGTSRELADYDSTAGEARRKVPQLRGKERGDPDRCAAAILQAIGAPEPPIHLFLGSGALRRARSRVEQITQELDVWEDLSNSTSFPDSHVVVSGKDHCERV